MEAANLEDSSFVDDPPRRAQTPNEGKLVQVLLQEHQYASVQDVVYPVFLGLDGQGKYFFEEDSSYCMIPVSLPL